MNINQLTIGEISKIEELSGQSINNIADTGTPQGKVMAALVYIIKRRENNSFTFANAMDLPLDEAQEILGITDDDDDDPKLNG